MGYDKSRNFQLRAAVIWLLIPTETECPRFRLIGVIVHYILCQKCQWYYERVLSGGIHVSFGRLYLTTHYFDQPVQKLGSCPGMVRLWRMWFICGLLVSSLLILPSLVLLIHIFYTHLSHMFAIRYASATSSGAALPPFVHASDTPFTVNWHCPAAFGVCMRQLTSSVPYNQGTR